MAKQAKKRPNTSWSAEICRKCAAVAYTSRDVIGDRSGRQGGWLNATLQVHFLTEYCKKEPCYSCLSGRALLLWGCYRKWWLVSVLNDLGGNFRLTFAKKSGIAKISQILEFLCFFSRLTIILAKQSVSIFIVKYCFDNEFIFRHKLLLLIELATTGRDVYYRSFLIYAWDVLFWLS